MKLSLLLCSFVLSLPAFCANTIVSQGNLNTEASQHYSIIAEGPPNHLKKPLRERKLFDKGRGTMGLILGIALGPVGYAGAHIFSHNIAIRERAKTGFAIWCGAAIVGLLIWQGIASKVSLDDVLYYTFQAIIQGLGS